MIKIVAGELAPARLRIDLCGQGVVVPRLRKTQQLRSNGLAEVMLFFTGADTLIYGDEGMRCAVLLRDLV